MIHSSTPSAFPAAPKPRQEPFVIEQHGQTRVDEYRWMKDENWQNVLADPKLLRADIREALEAENAYTEAMLADTTALQETLFQEMRGRIQEADSSVPVPDGPFDYYIRFEAGAQYPIHARKPRGKQGPEEILLNEELESRGKSYFLVRESMHSPDHRYYAYAVDEQGSEIFTIKIRNIETGLDLPDVIAPVAYASFVWSPDGRFIFWAFRNENGRASKIYRRSIHCSSDGDVLVYEEPDDGFFLNLGVTTSREFVVIQCGNQEQSECWTIAAADPEASPTLFQPRLPNLIYHITHWNGAWYIRTNADGATDFQVMKCQLHATSLAAWKQVVPAKPGRYVVSVSAVRDHLVRLELVNALPQIVILEKDGSEHSIEMKEEAYQLLFIEGSEWDTSTIRYLYESPSTPRRWFDYEIGTRTRVLLKEQNVPSGHDPERYVVRRFFTTARDGARIPVTTISLKTTPCDGTAPLLVYGYGSYGHSLKATFSIVGLSLLERGWVMATAHVRGGAEMGFGWFQAGRKFQKKNTFFDFLDVTEDLVAKGFGARDKVVARGGSAGGLLMGVIANLRPDLYRAILAEVPFVDVLNTMSDSTLPLTPPEWPEWGNPLTDPEAFSYIASYCPYTNVAARDYPAILATGGLTDPRVTWWEPQKWTARLRRHTTSHAPILLHLFLEAGHGGPAGRFDDLKEAALAFAFAIKAVDNGFCTSS